MLSLINHNIGLCQEKIAVCKSEIVREKFFFVLCDSNAIMIAYQVMVIYSPDLDVRTLECQPSIKAGEFQRRVSNASAEILSKNKGYTQSG
jgi:hypothetical protein